MSGQYPADEFDNVPADVPVGVHRKPPSPWHSIVPFLVVLLLVPLLAWGITALVRNRVSDEDVVFVEEEQSLEQVQSEPIEEEVIIEAEGDEPTAAPDDPFAGEEEEDIVVDDVVYEVAAEVDYQASIAVLNASGIAGYAAQTMQELHGAGFPNAFADNSSDRATPENTVYYSGPEWAATAAQVAEVLGISSVVENAGAATAAHVVVLLRY